MTTDFITEVQYLYFKENLKRVITYTLSGFVVGAVASYFFISMGSIFYSILFGIMLAGIPYAWCFIRVYPFGILGHILKLVVSLFLGWIVTPIAFIYYLVQVKRYEKMIERNPNVQIK